MTKPECRETRRELDEVRLGTRLSVATLQHLQRCAECQDFHQKQTKLRELVGSLGLVEAPADFDLQLRRRLANEGNGSGYRFPLALWPVTLRTLTVVAAVVLIFAAFLLVRNMFGPKLQEPRITREIPKETAPTPQPPALNQPPERKVDSIQQGIVAVDQPQLKKRAPVRLAANKQRQSFATWEPSSTVAPVFRTEQSFEATPFTISASQQSLKLSLDDGSGVRTISVPRVTFGSQRVLTSTNAATQVAPKGVW